MLVGRIAPPLAAGTLRLGYRNVSRGIGMGESHVEQGSPDTSWHFPSDETRSAL